MEQIVWKLDIGVVDFVDQKNNTRWLCERLAKWPEFDVAFNVFGIAFAKTSIVQALNGIVEVQPVLRTSRAFYRPRNQRQPHSSRNGFGKQGFARARFAFDQQRALQ